MSEEAKTRLKDQMQSIKARHAELSQRASEAISSQDVLQEVCDFIKDIRKMGSLVPPGDNRDLLVSLASYWATYYFQHSEENTYPQTNLEPYLGSLEKGLSHTYVLQTEDKGLGGFFTRWLLRFLEMPVGGRVAAVALPLLGLSILIAVLARPGGLGLGPKATATLGALVSSQEALETAQAHLTEVASMPTVTSKPPTTTPIPSSSQGPTRTSTPTLPHPVFIPSLTSTAGADSMGVSVLINNLNDLREVPPRLRLNVTYTNFAPDWSLHLLLQPLSQGLKYYPVPEFYIVEKGNFSGEWSVTVSFGSDDVLDRREQYTITPVVATTEDARRALQAAVQTGFEQLPEGVFTSPQVITRVYTVLRPAFTAIHELRLIYSAFGPEFDSLDLFAIRLDGSDPLRLTASPEISELYPDLSPDGTRIAFVGRTRPAKDEIPLHSLWLMDTNGTNRLKITEDPELVYDSPSWSPDGKTIAYSTSPIDTSAKDTQENWAIYLYDLRSERAIRLPIQNAFARHPAWAADGKSLYFRAINPETGTLGIYLISLDNQEIKRIYDEKSNEIQPVVSPDGSKLLFQDFDNTQLIVLDLATGRVEPLKLPSIIDFGNAIWGPDGLSIYFHAKTSSDYAIWMMPLDGSRARQLTPGNLELYPCIGVLNVYLLKE